jgi:hypothetical protein
MPAWMVWVRRVLAVGLIVWIVLVTALFGPAAFMLFAPHIVLCFVVAAYAFSRKRGTVGSALTMLLSASVFASLAFYPLILIFGPTPFGIPELIDDWIAGRDPNAAVNLLLVARSGLMLSAGLAVFATFLLGIGKLRKLGAKRIAKIAAVAVVMLPILVMLAPTGEGVVNPSVTRPWGWGGDGRYRLDSDWNTTRVYENGRWVYSLRLYNRGQENTIVIRIWAWHESVEPLLARVTFNGTGISVSAQGILFKLGAAGTMTSVTEQGHNRVTLLLTDDSVNTFSW